MSKDFLQLFFKKHQTKLKAKDILEPKKVLKTKNLLKIIL